MSSARVDSDRQLGGDELRFRQRVALACPPLVPGGLLQLVRRQKAHGSNCEVLAKAKGKWPVHCGATGHPGRRGVVQDMLKSILSIEI